MSDLSEYIGDGVYASFDGCHVILRTGHHDESQCDNQIFLELEVLQRLNEFNNRMKANTEGKDDE